jgi:hypothetical protein
MGLFVIGNLFVTGAIPPSIRAESSQEQDTRSWMIALPQDIASEPEVFQIGPLEEGETRQFFTATGVEITVSRGEDGRVIKVNGEEIETHINHTALVVSADEDHEHKTVHIRKKHVVHPEDVEIEHLEIDEDSVDQETEKEHAVHVLLRKTDGAGVHVNTITTGESGLQLVIIDRMHFHKED